MCLGERWKVKEFFFLDGWTGLRRKREVEDRGKDIYLNGRHILRRLPNKMGPEHALFLPKFQFRKLK